MWCPFTASRLNKLAGAAHNTDERIQSPFRGLITKFYFEFYLGNRLCLVMLPAYCGEIHDMTTSVLQMSSCRTMTTLDIASIQSLTLWLLWEQLARMLVCAILA